MSNLFQTEILSCAVVRGYYDLHMHNLSVMSHQHRRFKRERCAWFDSSAQEVQQGVKL